MKAHLLAARRNNGLRGEGFIVILRRLCFLFGLRAGFGPENMVGGVSTSPPKNDGRWHFLLTLTMLH
jgi:hypothetical protein